jgi:hypothetical protein
LTKWQVDETDGDKMACWYNRMLTNLANWQNGNLMKWQFDEMAN